MWQNENAISKRNSPEVVLAILYFFLYNALFTSHSCTYNRYYLPFLLLCLCFLFIKTFGKDLHNFVTLHSDVSGVILSALRTLRWSGISNVHFLGKGSLIVWFVKLKVWQLGVYLEVILERFHHIRSDIVHRQSRLIIMPKI